MGIGDLFWSINRHKLETQAFYQQENQEYYGKTLVTTQFFAVIFRCANFVIAVACAYAW